VKRDNFVDYARLGLAVSVCLFHLAPQYGTWPKGFRPDWAVPAFLSISGYYVLRSYELSASWLEFIKKRALRILPAFLISLLVVQLAGGFEMVKHVLLSYVTLGTVERDPLLNGPVWSLGAEEIAYAVLAVLFALGAYRRVWPIWVAFFVSGAIAAWVAAPTTDDHVMRIMDVVPAFFAGSLVYLNRDRVRGESAWGLLLISAAVFALMFHVDGQPFGWWWWMPGTWMGLGILSLRALRVPRIPDFSYGCYIYHMPFYALLVWPWWGYFPAFVLLCVGSWYLVERPVLSLKGGGRPVSVPVPAAVAPVET